MKKLLFLVSLMLSIINRSTFTQTIEKENISAGEKIIGLEFTEAERDSMIGDLDGQLRDRHAGQEDGALEGFLDVLWRDLGPAALLPEIAVLLGWSALFFFVARRLARRWELA